MSKIQHKRRKNAHHKTINQVAAIKLDKTFGMVPLQQFVESKIILRSATLGSTTALGVVNTVISMDPSAAVGWGEVSTYYDEFRVMGAKLQIYCLAPNSVTRISDLVTVVFDNDDSTVINGTSVAYAYADKMLFPSTYLNTRDGMVFSAVRPSTKTSPVPWVDVQQSNLSLGAFKFYSETLDASVAFFRIYYEYYVEVRGRR